VSQFRTGVSLAGLLIAIMAIATDDHRLVWVAIGFLAASLAIRISLAAQRRRRERRSPADHSDA